MRRPHPVASRRHALVLMVGIGLLTSGCIGDRFSPPASSESGAAAPTSTGAAAPASTGTPDPTATAAPTSTAGSTATAEPTALPGSCTELIPTTAVVDAVARPLPGGVSFVTAGPIESSGRTGRTTCGYGVPADGGDPAVQVSLNGYTDAATAQERIQRTVTRSQADGDTVIPQPVGERSGYVLRGRERSSLVVADGARTLVVTVRAGVVPAAATRPVLHELASVVLGRPGE